MNTKRKCEPCGIMEDWFLRIDNLEQISVTQTADINALYADVADLQDLVVGNVNLSLLVINTDKDWLGYNITNVGSIEVDGAVNCNSLNTGAAQASSLSVQNLSIGEYISGNLAPLVDNSIDVGSLGLNRWFKNGYFKGNLNVDGTVDGVDISGSINQGVKTTDSPSFNQLTLNASTGMLQLPYIRFNKGAPVGICNTGGLINFYSDWAGTTWQDIKAKDVYCKMGYIEGFKCNSRIQVRNIADTAYQDIDMKRLYISGSLCVDQDKNINGLYIDASSGFKKGGVSGLTTTQTFKDGSGATKTMTISGGIITSIS